MIVGCQQKDRPDSQELNIDTLYRPPVTPAQCVISTEKYPASFNLLNYYGDDYSEGYGQIEEPFRALTEADILNCFITDHDYRSSNEDSHIGYKSYVFDIRYLKNPESAQPTKVEFKFPKNIPAVIYG